MAKKKKKDALAFLDFTSEKQGFVVLLAGLIAAIVLGLMGVTVGTWIFMIGIIVGILNIFHKEGLLFLVLGLTLAFMFFVLAGVTMFSVAVATAFELAVYLLASSTIIVGLKVLYALVTK